MNKFPSIRCSKGAFYSMLVPQNVSDSANNYSNSILTRYLVAVLAAWAAEGVTYPLDLAKTRMQIQTEIASAKHGFKMEKMGLVKTTLNIAKKEGILKLWAGVSAMLQRHVIYGGTRLVAYERLRELLKDNTGHLSLASSTFAGVSAGVLAQFVASPADLIKIQMQAEGRRVLQGKPKRFDNCRQVYKMVYQTSGILGFWRGAIPNMQRAAFVNIGDLAAYDYSKQMLIKKFGMSDTLLAHTIAAYIAGFVAAVLATPADVMKTRLMNQPIGPDGRGELYKGMFDCFKQSVKNEGIFALYKGFLPLWVRLGPWTLVNWVVFENVMIAIGGKTF